MTHLSLHGLTGHATILAAVGLAAAGCSNEDVTGFVGAAKRIAAAGNGHTCSVRSNGEVSCWGWNLHGQLGDGSKNDSATPLRVGSQAVWIDVAAGAHHSCAIRNDNWLWCWGWNEKGQLGTGGFDDQYTPLATAAGERWASVSAGTTHTCAIRTDKSLWCWGNNVSGQIGNGESGALQKSPAPERITDYTDWLVVQAGDSHNCGVRGDGTLWCWGSNVRGQLGDGTTTDRLTPVQVASDRRWVSVDAGYYHSCAIGADASLWCWGDNVFGQLGDGTQGTGNQRLEPIQIGAEAEWKHLALGDYHSCAQRADHTIWCWGDNQYGQLGDGSDVAKAFPVRVSSDNDWLDLASGNDHTCGMLGDESLWCWGRNDYGQLGDGSLTNRGSPVMVQFP